MPPRKPRNEDQGLGAVGRYLRYSHLGILFLVSIGLPLAGGIWLDRKLGTEVLFTLLGLVLGFAAGITALYTELFRRKNGSSEERSSGAGPKDRPEDGE